jgi:hypothetical protein
MITSHNYVGSKHTYKLVITNNFAQLDKAKHIKNINLAMVMFMAANVTKQQLYVRSSKS